MILTTNQKESFTVIKIAIKQMNSIIADFNGNTAIMIKAMRDAADNSADIVVFPELSLCGYYPYDLIDEPFFIDEADKALEQLVTASNQWPQLTILVGTVRANKGAGKPFYNALVVIKSGEINAEYYKQLLPTYNIFDERRHFEPGPAQPCIIDLNGTTIGLIICEDGWNDLEEQYAENPFNALIQLNPDLIISINASPSNIGKRQQRHHIISQAMQRYHLPLLSVNSVGGQDSLVFDGASFAVDKAGQIVFEAASFKDSQEYLSFDSTGFQQFTSSKPIISNDELAFEQIVLGLKDYTRKCGFNRVVIGSSGGIDSALTMALAVEALGAENVSAITMPSVFSSDGSVSDSEKLCQNLDMPLINHPIKGLVEQYGIDFNHAFDRPLKGLTLENLQARIRGTILMEYSNEYGAFLLTTGNKSEISIGYCTLYGDTNGGLNLLGDLYKTEVYSLSRYINERAQYALIPTAIIDKEPSAELAPDQKDTDSLPAYEVLDNILKYLIEGQQLSDDEHVQVKEYVEQVNQSSPELVRKIKRMIAINEYKRFQASPIIRIRARAFGNGRQMPIAAKY